MNTTVAFFDSPGHCESQTFVNRNVLTLALMGRVLRRSGTSATASRLLHPRAFTDPNGLIYLDRSGAFLPPAWPGNLHRRFLGATQTKVQPRIMGRKITLACPERSGLRQSSGGHLDAGSHGHAITGD